MSAALAVFPYVRPVSAETIRLGIAPTVHSAFIYIAEAEGFFRKRGITVSMNDYRAGALAIGDLVADKVDMVTAAEFVFVLQSFAHPELRMPATICAGQDVEFVVRKDRGITRPQDLTGKRIAVTKGSSVEFFLYNYLIFNNLQASKINVVYYGPSEMVTAMAQGMIDAALSWPPYTTEMANRLGAKGDRWPAQSGQDYYFALCTKESFVKKEPGTMEQFLAALSEAEDFAAKHPDRAQEIMRQRLDLDVASVRASWPRLRFQLQLTQDMLVLMEREAKWAMRSKLVQSKQMPNFLDFFYFQALDKIKPEAVTIVH